MVMTDSQNPCENVELYALGALDDEETKQFKAHLNTCDDCNRELKEHWMPVVNTLPWAVDDVEPPTGMKSRILAHVLQQEEQPLTPPAPVASPEARPRTVPRKSGGRWLTGGLAAAVGALVIFSGMMVQQVRELGGESDRLAEQVRELEALLATADEPGATLLANNVVQLDPATSDIVARGLATIVIDDKGMHLIVQAEQLPALADEEAYQVWLLKEGQPVNAGTFKPFNGTGALYYTFSPDDYDTIAITREPDALGDTPRGSMVLLAPLTSA